jgi:hypothetical protein
MPPIKAHAKVFRNWEGLIGACEQNAGRLTGMESLITDLKDFVAQAKEIKVEQEHQTGLRKVKTQRLNLVLDGGKEAVRKLHAFILTRYDSRDEQLTQFGIRPNRSRKQKLQPTKPPVPEAAAPTQEATGETVSPSALAEETTNPPAAAPAAE